MLQCPRALKLWGREAAAPDSFYDLVAADPSILEALPPNPLLLALPTHLHGLA